jgi:uncharacterized protein YsxB (DUF464 family)
MVKINVRSKDGYIEIVADGHANSAPHGQDIICASVSAILQTAILGLEAIADQYPDRVQMRYDSAE